MSDAQEKTFERVIPLTEVARRIGIDYETARRWANERRIPVFRFTPTGRWVAYPSQVDEFVSAHKNKAAAWSEQ